MLWNRGLISGEAVRNVAFDDCSEDSGDEERIPEAMFAIEPFGICANIEQIVKLTSRFKNPTRPTLLDVVRNVVHEI